MNAFVVGRIYSLPLQLEVQDEDEGSRISGLLGPDEDVFPASFQVEDEEDDEGTWISDPLRPDEDVFPPAEPEFGSKLEQSQNDDNFSKNSRKITRFEAILSIANPFIRQVMNVFSQNNCYNKLMDHFTLQRHIYMYTHLQK